MKTILTSTILFLPCFLMLNESETIMPNLIGVAYVVSLYLVGQTKPGKLFLKKLYKETCKLENKLLK